MGIVFSSKGNHTDERKTEENQQSMSDQMKDRYLLEDRRNMKFMGQPHLEAFASYELPVLYTNPDGVFPDDQRELHQQRGGYGGPKCGHRRRCDLRDHRPSGGGGCAFWCCSLLQREKAKGIAFNSWDMLKWASQNISECASLSIHSLHGHHCPALSAQSCQGKHRRL